jgi:hypothetical protein
MGCFRVPHPSGSFIAARPGFQANLFAGVERGLSFAVANDRLPCHSAAQRKNLLLYSLLVILAQSFEVVILAQPFEVVILAQPESPYLSLSLLLSLHVFTRHSGAVI